MPEESGIYSDGPSGRLHSSVTNDRHVLVVGGAGYIGSVLARKLLEQGYRVRVLDRLIYDNGPAIAGLAEHPGFSFAKGDLGNTGILGKAMDDVTDVVLLAALAGDTICDKYPDLARKVNLEYPKQLMSMMKDRDIQRFVFSSDCSCYGLRREDTPADEESELRPQSVYTETKAAFEQHILYSLGGISFCPVILRLSDAYGISPRMRFDLKVSGFTRHLTLGRDLQVNEGNTVHSYCHVSDISNAIISVLEARRHEVFGQIFNVGSDSDHYSDRMLAELIRRYIPLAVVNYHREDTESRHCRVSFEKIGTVLEFSTEYTAEDSIRGLIGAMRSNLFPGTEGREDFYGNYRIQE